MKLSDLVTIAQKAQQYVGDAEVRIKGIEGEIEHELTGVETFVTAVESEAPNIIKLVHAPVTQAGASTTGEGGQ